MNNLRHTTHGIVHAGFSSFRRFVARKKSRCKLIGNRLVIPHDTIPSTVMPYAKKTRETLRNLIIILTILPLLTFGQKEKRKSVETYVKSDGNFYYRLDLFSDSTFKYEHSFELGSTMSQGRWKQKNDTLTLYDYEVPWKVEKIEEKYIDTLTNKTIVKVIMNDTNAIHIRGNHEIYIDGQPSNVRYDHSTKTHNVFDFEVWINSDCKTKIKTNELGVAEFKTKDISEIYIAYNRYSVINPRSNYFTLTISNYPILTSPPTLKWTIWTIQGQEIKPVECGRTLKHLTLTKE